MASLDRLLIGSLVSISAVAYYATPSEVITRLLIVPLAIVGVLFPAFSSGFVQDKARTKLLFVRGVKYTSLAIFPFLLVVIVFAREGMTLWVGAEFAKHGTTVLQWLAMGVFFNGIGQIPFALVQGSGRPDITGKLHLIELPVYTAVLWLLVHSRGIEGAAIAWTTRVVADAIILFGVSYRILRTEPQNLRRFAAPIACALLLLTLGSIPMSIYLKFSFTALTLFAFGFISWFALLDPAERLYARTWIRAY
jgi:O-antigen/teichoic acid export membrane protein